MGRARWILSALAVAAMVWAATVVPWGAARARGEPETRELRGRVVCLAEDMHTRHGAELSARHEHLWGLRVADEEFYALLRTRFSEAIFQDETVRQRELVVRARVFPKSHLIELLNLRTVKDGAVCDLTYYCQVCEIYAVAPGICECCQGPSERLERPLHP